MNLSRQVLYLMGPVGSGKSSLVEKLQQGLEASGPFYAIEDCPMFEEPLHLLPRHLRREFEKMLGVKIEGDLCPVCRFRLKDQYSEHYEEVPVVARSFSKRNRAGIGVVPSVDPNNQDTSVLIGSEDISKLDMCSEGDPRVLDLDGALNVGNRQSGRSSYRDGLESLSRRIGSLADIYRRSQEEGTGDGKLFEVRESDPDSSFLRRHLNKDLLRELNLFEYETKGDEKIVRNVADRDGWKQVKETLLKNVGMNSVPVIKVEDADFGHNHTLYLIHYHDGRELQLEYAEKMLAYLSQIWHGEAALETVLDGKRYLLTYSDGDFSTKELR